MRILHITPYYEHAWAYGGIPRIVGTIAPGLVSRGHAVSVATTDARTADRRLERPASVGGLQPWHERTAAGVEVHVFPNLSNSIAYHLQFFVPLGLSRFLRAHAGEFDIAHVHACHNIPGALAARYLAAAGVPYVLTPNGTAPLIERRVLAKRAFDASVGRHVLGRAAKIQAVTEAERLQLHALEVTDDRIAVIPNPIDLAEFSQPIERGAFRRRTGVGSGEIVMFLGKLTPRKRLDVLVRAFERLGRPGARLVIAGNDMGYGAELAHLVDELALGERTIVTGLLAGRDRLEALADASVVCYASKDEIFGLVPIEAILCGTPVVVADDSGCGEVIGEVGGGRVVPQGDVDALATAIGDVLDASAAWRADAAAAAGRVRVRYGADAVCAQLEQLYVEVLASRRP